MMRCWTLRMLCVCVCVCCCVGQIVSHPRDQPAHIYMNHTHSCCHHIDNTESLLECTNERMESLSVSVSSEVSLVTYISDHIADYAAYAALINAMYAEHNSYAFSIFSPSKGHNFEPRDQRWNKVKILLDALEADGCASSAEYVVWLDADLIVMDMGMSVQAIGEAYPHADVVMSKDISGAPALANSGYILVRNTPWTRDFLTRWWNDFERDRMSDQTALLLLHTSLPEADKEKVQVLRADAVNSYFPPWLHQQEYNQVLHLAGETNTYRKHVFKMGLMTLCNARIAHDSYTERVLPDSNPEAVSDMVAGKLDSNLFDAELARGYGWTDVPRQLSLSLSVLKQFHDDLQGYRVAELKRLRDSRPQFEIREEISHHTLRSIWQQVDRIHSKTLNLIKQPDDRGTDEEQSTIEYYELASQSLEFCYSTFKKVALLYSSAAVSTHSRNEDMRLFIAEKFRMTISTAYDIMDFKNSNYELLQSQSSSLASKEYATVVSLLEDVGNSLIPQLQRYLSGSFYGKGRYYEFKYYQFLFDAKEKAGYSFADALPSMLAAADIWRELHRVGYYGVDYISIDPLKEGSRLLDRLAVRMCMELNGREEESLGIFEEAQKHMTTTLNGYHDTPLATPGNIQEETLALAVSFTNSGGCGSKLTDKAIQIRAVRDMKTAIDYFDRYSVLIGKALPSVYGSLYDRMKTFTKTHSALTSELSSSSDRTLHTTSQMQSTNSNVEGKVKRTGRFRRKKTTAFQSP